MEVDASIIKNIVTRLLELWDIETGSDFGDDLFTALCLNTKTFSPEGLDILLRGSVVSRFYGIPIRAPLSSSKTVG